MNLEKVFNFIKEKRGYDYPFKYRLINGLPISDEELNVKGNLSLTGSDIKSLPNNLNVHGFLYLRYSNITSLPDNLKVEGGLILFHSNISSIPNNLFVRTTLNLEYTPLSSMYNKEEIRQMIEDKGGYVGGNIWI